MHINPNLFIIARPPNQIVWNYKTHTQYALNIHYAKRLSELINNPNSFDADASMDAEFLASGIISTSKQTTPTWKWDELSKIFHIGTKDIPCEHEPQDIEEWSVHYLEHCNEILKKPAPDFLSEKCSPLDLIPLPPPLLTGSLEMPLAQSLISRKTCRSFTEDEICLSHASTLLYLSLGYLKEREQDADETIPETLRSRRSSPSGGGLNACDGFIYARRIKGLSPGIYRYHPDHHALSLARPLPAKPLGLLLAGQHFINTLPFGVFLTCRFDKLWWKYEHSRAYRMAYVETGHISQTFQLIATALGLKTWLTGAMADERIEDLLGLKNSPEQVLFFVGCGKGDAEAHCEELRALIKERSAQH